jgi:Holliday junction resolvase RusA-like endonuclease
MPPAYKTAQAVMRKQIKEQWHEGPLEGPISLSIKVKGEGRGDTDNIAGAFMDVAQGIIFTDDRVSVIPSLSIVWEKATKAKSEWIIEIRLL